MFKASKTRPEPQVPERTYSSSEVAEVAASVCGSCSGGMSAKWSRRGMRGTAACTAAGEVIEITVIAELRRKGFSLAEDPPRAALPATRNGQAPGGSSCRLPRICTWSPTANRFILEDQHEPHHRHPEERAPAHVPGLRQRPGPPPCRIPNASPPAWNPVSAPAGKSAASAYELRHTPIRCGARCRTCAVAIGQRPLTTVTLSRLDILKSGWRPLNAISSPHVFFCPSLHRRCVPSPPVFSGWRPSRCCATELRRCGQDRVSSRSPRFTTRWSRISPIT